MADQENVPPPRVTRATAAAAKRGSGLEEGVSLKPEFKRKRIALGDVHNLTNGARGCVGKKAAAKKTRKVTAKKRVLGETRKKSDGPSCMEIEVAQETKRGGDECSCMEIDVSSVTTGGGAKEVVVEEDPQMVAPYDADIYRYLRSMEVEPKRRPLTNYMEMAQADISADMRAVLVDWLVDVGEEYKLIPETLYLTMSYVDRFLSNNSINRKRLQLLGVTAMLVASKYEEIYAPNVDDFCNITANTYNKQEVVQMERDLLRFLKYEVGTPTINIFLRRFLKDDIQNSNLALESLAYYLGELSLLDYGCIKFLPSVVAASAIFLARFTINPANHPWNEKLERSTGYKASELKECVHALLELQLNTRFSSLMAIKEKYKQDKFKCASTLLPQKEMLHIFFDKLEEESNCETKSCINADAVR